MSYDFARLYRLEEGKQEQIIDDSVNNEIKLQRMSSLSRDIAASKYAGGRQRNSSTKTPNPRQERWQMNDAKDIPVDAPFMDEDSTDTPDTAETSLESRLFQPLRQRNVVEPETPLDPTKFYCRPSYDFAGNISAKCGNDATRSSINLGPAKASMAECESSCQVASYPLNGELVTTNTPLLFISEHDTSCESCAPSVTPGSASLDKPETLTHLCWLSGSLAVAGATGTVTPATHCASEVGDQGALVLRLVPVSVIKEGANAFVSPPSGDIAVLYGDEVQLASLKRGVLIGKANGVVEFCTAAFPDGALTSFIVHSASLDHVKKDGDNVAVGDVIKLEAADQAGMFLQAASTTHGSRGAMLSLAPDSRAAFWHLATRGAFASTLSILNPPAPAPVVAAPAPPPPPARMPTWAKVAIGVGVGALLLGGAALYMKHRKAKAGKAQAAPAPQPAAASGAAAGSGASKTPAPAPSSASVAAGLAAQIATLNAPSKAPATGAPTLSSLTKPGLPADSLMPLPPPTNR